MWLLLPEYVFRRPETHKCFEYKTIPPFRVFYKSIELTVRTRTCSSIPQLHVAIRIKNPVLPEQVYIFFSYSDRSPPLNNKGAISLAGQKIRTEKSGGPASDNHRSAGQMFRTVCRSAVWTFGYFL